MNEYKLKSDESVLFKGNGSIEGIKGSAKIQLTNYNIVLDISAKKNLFSKADTSVLVYPINKIKVYKNEPQVKAKGYKVEIYLEDEQITLSFISKVEAQKFILKAKELITGKTIQSRGIGKIKDTLDMVDDTLGIDVADVAKGVLGNGVVGTIVGGLGNRNEEEPAEESSEAPQNENNNQESTKAKEEKLSINEQIEAVKQLKELLDIGAITEDEFKSKKEQIMNN